MKKWQKFLIWFAWSISFVLACDLSDYWLEHNLLNTWRLNTVEAIFLLLGVISVCIDNKLRHKIGNKKKR